MNVKLEELFALLNKRDEEMKKEQKNTIVIAFAIVGAVLAVVAIAFLVYRHFSPDYLEDFEDDFDDEFDDYFEDDDDEEPAKEEIKEETKEEEVAEEE